MKLKGIPIFPGVVFGKALLHVSERREEYHCKADALTDPAEKLAAFAAARACALAELQKEAEHLRSGASSTVEIIDAQQELLLDVAINAEIQSALEDGACVSHAIEKAYGTYINILKMAENAFTHERVLDMEDVCGRLLRCLSGTKPVHSLSHLDEPVILVADTLYPSDTAALDRKKVLAIVTETGGETSHTAIVARSYGIPTVLGAAGVMNVISPGMPVAVDADAGVVYANPTEEERAYCIQRQRVFAQKACLGAACQQALPLTLDQVRVQVKLNISDADSALEDAILASDGVGLMRSEFLYMERDSLPDEQAQYNAYLAVLRKFSGKPVILRTLDIGGDKQLACMKLPREENPFLGKRALRLCFDRQDLFRTQIRAALRASVEGDLRIMFPMVGSLTDWRRAKALVHDVMGELEQEGVPFRQQIPLGIMIEIPSIALQADKAALEVDFASVGTNDLCQYLTAADRLNPEVSEYCQMFTPSLFRLVRFAAGHFQRAGKPLGVCGEMGGDPRAALALIGLGIRSLSMNASSIAVVKYMITHIDSSVAKRLADEVCEMDTAEDVKTALSAYLDSIGI